MDKGDAGLYKFPRRNRSKISLRNQNPSSGDNRIQQPPWKLGISGGGSGSSAGASHHKPQKSHSPEKPGSSTLDTTKNVRRSSSRPLGTRPFKEKHKQKRSYVAESSSSSTGTDTGKSATQVLAEAGDMPDFVDSSVWSRGIGSSSSSSSSFLSQRNKQINLGSTCNGTGTGTGTGMHRRSGTKSFGCTSAPAVVPSDTEGVKKRFNGEGSSSVARQLTSMAAGGSNVHVTTRGVSVSQVESRISRVIARNNETDLWALRADWVLASSQEDQREEEEAEKDDLDEDEEEEEDEDEEDYEDEAQPSRFAFLLPHQLYASSSQSRLDSGSGFGSSGLMSNSTSDSASSISSRMAPWSGPEESGRTSHRTMQHGLRLRDREAYRRDGIAEVRVKYFKTYN